MTTPRSRQRKKTFSLWDEKRLPSEYEVVTHRFHYHFRRDPVPFELSPDWTLNRWYLEHREGSVFNVDDWEKFRDPHALTYRRYVARRNEREIYIDNVIDEFEARDHYRSLSPAWLDFLARAYFPSRFAGHGLQMSGAYVAQMAPSAFITNAFNFQAADEMRRIQRSAYLAAAMARDADRPDLADSARCRETWEDDPSWQPLREAIEKHLVAYDWGEAFGARNLVVKPLFDALFNVQFANLARRNGDQLLAIMHDDFWMHDSQYSREITVELARYAVERKPELAGVLNDWVARWTPVAERGIQALAEAFSLAPEGPDPSAVVEGVRAAHRSLLESCGLDDPYALAVRR
jgi:toluene monooxygenase system protein E